MSGSILLGEMSSSESIFHTTAMGPTSWLAFREEGKCYFKFQMDSSFHSCHVNRSSSLKYILSGVYTEPQEPALTPRLAFIVPPAAVSQYGILKAALLHRRVKVSKFPLSLSSSFPG